MLYCIINKSKSGTPSFKKEKEKENGETEANKLSELNGEPTNANYIFKKQPYKFSTLLINLTSY